MTTNTYSVGENGVMQLAGHDATALAERFGTPLLVILEDEVRARCRAYREHIGRNYPRARVYYASKALLTTGFCKLIADEGLGLDVVTWGELATAMAAGFDPEMILMHGNGKTCRDLEAALDAGVGRIVIDNFQDIDNLARLAAARDREVKVFIRVTPGVKPSTHRFVQTGQVDSKYGFNLSGGAAEEAVRRILGTPRLQLVGLHCHIGSQIFDLKPFAIAAGTMMRFYAHVQKDLGAPLDELNMGGGLGIRYDPDDCPPTVAEHLAALGSTVLGAAQSLGVDPPLLCDEPGRSIVGEAGVSLYTAQSIKCIPGVRNYVTVDGGMTDNPRYVLYGARHQMVAASRMHDPCNTLWSVSGRCCESGDMLIHDVSLPDVQPGDLIGVLATGAYTYGMASNYNRIERPAVALVAPGRADLLAAREDAAHLLGLDRIPAWLAADADEREQDR